MGMLKKLEAMKIREKNPKKPSAQDDCIGEMHDVMPEVFKRVAIVVGEKLHDTWKDLAGKDTTKYVGIILLISKGEVSPGVLSCIPHSRLMPLEDGIAELHRVSDYSSITKELEDHMRSVPVDPGILMIYVGSPVGAGVCLIGDKVPDSSLS